MNRHIAANLWLLLLTIVICSVAYPLLLLGIGQIVYHDKANGSIVTDDVGTPIGSHLIAQPFAGDEYFHPRPSAVTYNAAATGGSNWGGNNPALRKRVVGMLGAVLKYRDGRPVGPDIVKWVRENVGRNPAIVQQWADADPSLAAIAIDDVMQDDGKILSAFFETWWRAHPQADVEPVPADMVMASGSGIDPHITLAGAMYQLDRVAAVWAARSGGDTTQTKGEIQTLLARGAAAPLVGLAGVKLVNVLEVNLALRANFASR